MRASYTLGLIGQIDDKERKLQQRLEYLEDRLYKETLAEHERINNMGWGHAMRCVKSSISFSKSDKTRAQIEKVKQQLKNYDTETNH